MKSYLLTIALICVSQLSMNAQSNEIILQPGAEGKDAMVLSYNPDNNYGNYKNNIASSWTVSGSQSHMRSLIQFDLSSIPDGAVITEASLSLYFAYYLSDGKHCSEGGTNEALLSRVTEDWNESTITWNNQPSYTTEDEVTLPSSVHPQQNYENIDVTALIQDMVTNENYGFIMRLNTESSYRRLTFASGDNEDSSTHPKLVVKYTTNAGSKPERPTNLLIEETSPLNIELNWDDNATNESNYIIEKSEGINTNFQVVETLPANSTSTIISEDINNKTKYFFRIKAVDPNGYYSYSDEKSIITGGFSIADGDTVICNKYFFDTGVNFPYNSHENYVQTISPETSGKILKITFNSLSLSSGDKLSIYDGNSVSSPLIKEVTGSAIPDSINALNEVGSLTFKFISDGDISKNDGWEAYISCIDPTYPPHDLISNSISTDSIKFSWTDTISNETSFQIQRSLNNIDYSTIYITEENVVTYVDISDFFSGSDYYYRIRTLTSEGYSDWSDTLHVLTPGPRAPSDLTVISADNSSVNLTWIDNSDNEEGFIIERSLDSESDFSIIGDVESDITSYTDDGLDFNTGYYYRMRAFEGNDSSNYTPVKSVLVGGIIMDDEDITRCNYYLLDPGGLDNYPDNLNKTITLFPEGSNYIKLDFESFNVRSFDYLYIYDGINTSSPLVAQLSGTTLPESVNATNTNGALTLKFTSSSYNNSDGFKAHVTCVNIPNQPTGLTTTNINAHDVTLEWNDEYTNETGFSIFRSDNISGPYTEIGNVEENITQFTNTNLHSGTTYFYKIRVSENNAYSKFSDTIDVQTTGPLAPSGFSTQSNSQTSIHLNWNDNSDNEDYFIIQRSLNDNSDFEIIDSVETDKTEYLDSNLISNTIYYYRLYAKSGGDTSEYVSSKCLTNSFIMQDDTLLSRCDYYLLDPGGLYDYSNNVNNTMVLQPKINDFQVKLIFESFNLENNWDKLYIYNGETTSDSLVATLTGSSNPDEIIATNSSGSLTLKMTSDGSIVRSGFKIYVNCIHVPNAPSDLNIINEERNSVTFNWTDNSEYEDAYIIYRSLQNDGPFNPIDTLPQNTIEFTDHSLNTGTDYYYSIKAKCGDELSGFSDTLNATTNGLVCPEDLTAKATGRTTIALEWIDNVPNEESFEVVRSLSENGTFELIASTEANQTEFTDEDLEFDTEYFYKIRAISANDSSDYTQVKNAKAGHIIFYDWYVSDCGYYLLDPGGEENYPNNQDLTLTLFRVNADEKIKLVIESFDLEDGADSLYIYDGSFSTDPLITVLTGSIEKDSIWGTINEGDLRLRFVSNDTVNSSGFIIFVSCVENLLTPTDLSMANTYSDSIEIHWIDNSDNETGFEIYRSLTVDGDYDLIDMADIDAVKYVDKNLDSNTEYSYKIRAINNEIYSTYSNTLTVSTLTGINNNKLIDNGYLLYPNPTNSDLNINLINKKTGKISVEIYSASGQLVKNKFFYKTDNEFNASINFTNLPEGVYLLRIGLNNEDFINEIIIKN